MGKLYKEFYKNKEILNYTLFEFLWLTQTQENYLYKNLFSLALNKFFRFFEVLN